MPIENFRGGGGRGGGRRGGRGFHGRGWRRPNYWNYGGWVYPGSYPYYFGPYEDQFYYDNLYNYPDTIYVNNLYNPLTNNPPNVEWPGSGGSPSLSKGDSSSSTSSKWMEWIKANPLIVSIGLAFILAVAFILGSLIYKRN